MLMKTTGKPVGKSAAGSHTGRWTRDEHQKFLAALNMYGREWKKVASHIRTRSSAQIRSHAQKYFAKLEKEKCQGLHGGVEAIHGKHVALQSVTSRRRAAGGRPKKSTLVVGGDRRPFSPLQQCHSDGRFSPVNKCRASPRESPTLSRRAESPACRTARLMPVASRWWHMESELRCVLERRKLLAYEFESTNDENSLDLLASFDKASRCGEVERASTPRACVADLAKSPSPTATDDPCRLRSRLSRREQIIRADREAMRIHGASADMACMCTLPSVSRYCCKRRYDDERAGKSRVGCLSVRHRLLELIHAATWESSVSTPESKIMGDLWVSTLAEMTMVTGSNVYNQLESASAAVYYSLSPQAQTCLKDLNENELTAIQVLLGTSMGVRPSATPIRIQKNATVSKKKTGKRKSKVVDASRTARPPKKKKLAAPASEQT